VSTYAALIVGASSSCVLGSMPRVEEQSGRGEPPNSTETGKVVYLSLGVPFRAGYNSRADSY
jgi:hypothetical protein